MNLPRRSRILLFLRAGGAVAVTAMAAACSSSDTGGDDPELSVWDNPYEQALAAGEDGGGTNPDATRVYDNNRYPTSDYYSGSQTSFRTKESRYGDKSFRTSAYTGANTYRDPDETDGKFSTTTSRFQNKTARQQGQRARTKTYRDAGRPMPTNPFRESEKMMRTRSYAEAERAREREIHASDRILSADDLGATAPGVERGVPLSVDDVRAMLHGDTTAE